MLFGVGPSVLVELCGDRDYSRLDHFYFLLKVNFIRQMGVLGPPLFLDSFGQFIVLLQKANVDPVFLPVDLDFTFLLESTS